MRSIVLLIGASLVSARPNNLPRADPDPEFARKVDEWASKRNPPKELADAMKNYQSFGGTEPPTLEDYTQPNQYITAIFSPGDSYTAGIGSNTKDDHFADSGWFCDKKCGRYSQAWPEKLRDLEDWRDLQGDGYRRNNFGACSGATIDDIMAKQLQLGENKDADQYKKIGTPQIAVLTAGGNDFKFGEVIQHCIIGILGTRKCERTLKWIEDSLSGSKREEAKAKYRKLFSSLIVAGRLAKGAEKPENFQVYMGTYIPFFGLADDVCDQETWNMRYTFGPKIWLTKAFRQRLNDMVESVNSVIEETVKEMEEWGVFLVNGYQQAFEGHKMCDAVPHDFPLWDLDYDKAYHSASSQDYGSQTWFWSWRGNWDSKQPNRPAVGYDHPIWKKYGGPLDKGSFSVSDDDDSSDKIKEILIPNAEQRAKVENGEADPDEFSDAFKDVDSMQAAIREIREDHPDVEAIFTDDSWYRIWHPKGPAQQEIAKAFMDTIRTNRKWDFNSQQQPEQPQEPQQPPEEAPKKKKTLIVGLQAYWKCNRGFQGLDICSNHENEWFFFTTEIGEQLTDLCREDMAITWGVKRWGGNEDFNSPPYPGGNYTVGDVMYLSDGSSERGLGAVYKDGQKVGDCTGDLSQADPLAKVCRGSSPYEKRRRVVSCDY